MTLDTGQNPKRFLPRIGIIVRPEEPQAAPTVLIHQLPDGLLARRSRRVHATIIRARRTGANFRTVSVGWQWLYLTKRELDSRSFSRLRRLWLGRAGVGAQLSDALPDPLGHADPLWPCQGLAALLPLRLQHLVEQLGQFLHALILPRGPEDLEPAVPDDGQGLTWSLLGPLDPRRGQRRGYSKRHRRSAPKARHRATMWPGLEDAP